MVQPKESTSKCSHKSHYTIKFPIFSECLKPRIVFLNLVKNDIMLFSVQFSLKLLKDNMVQTK